MNMGTLLRNIFHQEIPLPPEPEQHIPDETELRWARSKTESIKKRAKELQIEVDLTNDRHTRINNLDSY